MFKVIAKMEVAPDKCDDFMKNIAELALKAERCGGCYLYEPVRSCEEKNIFMIIEEWENNEMFEAHFKEPFIKKFESNCNGMFIKEIKTCVYDKIL